MVTFKQINQEKDICKEVKKVGLSVGIIFSKEEQDRYNIKYGSKILLNNAEVVANLKEEKPKSL